MLLYRLPLIVSTRGRLGRKPLQLTRPSQRKGTVAAAGTDIALVRTRVSSNYRRPDVVDVDGDGPVAPTTKDARVGW
jgi:hypothetical protein